MKEWGEYDSFQEKCPKCSTDNISNEDGPENGMLPVTCLDCGYQWVEPEFGEFLSNTADPSNPRTRTLFTGYTYDEWQEGHAGIERAWQRHLAWISQNVIGPPKATSYYTTEELVEMGMVGIYKGTC